MTTTLAGYPHLFQPGSEGRPVFVMLHGTGSNEQDIASLAAGIDDTAGVLAPRGRIVEGGMLRWFRRISEGVFDVDSVTEEAAALAGFLSEARDAYDLAGRPLVAIGFSNGANMALATALLHPDVVQTVVAFSGMYPLAHRTPPEDLSALQVLLLNGSDDAMAPAASVDRLEKVLRTGGADVTRRTRPGRHGITADELDASQSWITARSPLLA